MRDLRDLKVYELLVLTTLRYPRPIGEPPLPIYRQLLVNTILRYGPTNES